MSKRGPGIYDTLPEVIAERSASIIDLPADDMDQEPFKEQLKEFVESHVPKNDKNEVSDEVSWVSASWNSLYYSALNLPSKFLYYLSLSILFVTSVKYFSLFLKTFFGMCMTL